MLVGNGISRFLPVANLLSSLKISNVSFVSFQSNPSLDDVVSGVKLFNSENCDCIIAAGGGSAVAGDRPGVHRARHGGADR